jgi:hypothetical protein
MPESSSSAKTDMRSHWRSNGAQWSPRALSNDLAAAPAASSRASGPVSHLQTYALVLICAALVAYDALRCALMSITHDEALTYAWHVRGPINDILRFATPGLPDNNHLLFTLLCKLSVALFGDGELALRLPSILAYALFCAAAAAILMRHLRGPLLVLFLLLAALNPYVVDMMSIARGYGLGIALTTAGAYCLLRDAEIEAPPRAFWSASACLFLCLATLAHLSFLLVLAVGLGVMTLARLDAWRRGAIALRVAAAGLVWSALIMFAAAPLLLRQILILKGDGLLNAEGQSSFESETIRGAIDGAVYAGGCAAPVYAVLETLAYLLPLLALLLGVAGLARPAASAGARRAERDLLALAILLVGAALLSIAQHYWLGVAYLAERKTAFLFPLFAMLCGILFAAIRHRAAAWRWTMQPILLAMACAFVAHSALMANLRMTKDWFYDSQTKAMMTDLAQALPRTGAQRYRFGINWEFEPSINYYLRRNGWTSIAPVDRKGPAGVYDVYYIFDQTLPDVSAAVGPLTAIRHYDLAQATLALPAAGADLAAPK